MTQGGENLAAYAEVGMVHVRAFLRFGQGEGELAKVGCGHGEFQIFRLQTADYEPLSIYKSTIYNLNTAILPRW
jgi:hypothetical protein